MTNEQKNRSRWHLEYYLKAIGMAAAAGEKLGRYVDEHFGENSEIHWRAYFEEAHPALHSKYMAACDRITDLWGSMNPANMEEFKKTVKHEVDATIWAIGKFLEALKNLDPIATKHIVTERIEANTTHPLTVGGCGLARSSRQNETAPVSL